MNIVRTLAVALAVAFSSPVFAHDYKIGDLVIDHPYARATPPGAPVGGGYMTVKNTGESADRLVGATVDFAGRVEIHEMKMSEGVMKMRRIEGGLEIPAGGEVVLKPGGYHLMFMKLSEQLAEGENRKVSLEFEKAGRIEVEFSVQAISSSGKKEMKHDGHGEMKHEGHDMKSDDMKSGG